MMDDETKKKWIYKEKNKQSINPLNCGHEFNWKAQLLINLILKDEIKKNQSKKITIKWTMIKYDRRKIKRWWNYKKNKKLYWIKQVAIKKSKEQTCQVKKIKGGWN
jgi:hypothetical protein